MNLSEQLLVVPAVLGLIAPGTAPSAEHKVYEDYGHFDVVEEVESKFHLSDIYFTDLSHEPFVNFIKYPNCDGGNLKEGKRLSPSSSLSTQCLTNVAQITDEDLNKKLILSQLRVEELLEENKKLRELIAKSKLSEEEPHDIDDFDSQFVILKGRVDGLEARVGEFEAGQFSTTTKLSGKTFFVIGSFEKEGNQTDEAITFTYSTQLNLKSSFHGDDLLYTRLKTGNFGSSAFASKTYGNYLSATNNNSDVVKVDKIWYQFPIGDTVTVWAGPKIENYYMLASAPSIYKPVFKQFALGGNAGAYAASTDGGFGIAWTQPVEDLMDARWAVSTNYVSKGAKNAQEDGGGIFAEDTQSKWLTKVEYGSPRWQLSFAVAKEQCNKTDVDLDGRGSFESCKAWQAYYATEKGASAGTGDATSYSARAYWKPEEAGAMPALQVGFDLRNIDDDNNDGDVEQTASWMTGVMWDDVFVNGNRLGFAIGQRAYATNIQGENSSNDDNAKDNYVWEAYYDFMLSDNITVTPAIFGGNDTFDGDDDDILGGLVQTTFRF